MSHVGELIATLISDLHLRLDSGGLSGIAHGERIGKRKIASWFSSVEGAFDAAMCWRRPLSPSDMTDSTLGQRIRRRREALGFSLSKFAQLSGVSRSYLYQVESDESSPTVEKLVDLANALGVTVSDLLGASESPKVSGALAEFVQQANLPSADVEMLARISYRGRQPKTVEEWRILYSVIKTATETESSEE